MKSNKKSTKIILTENQVKRLVAKLGQTLINEESKKSNMTYKLLNSI